MCGIFGMIGLGLKGNCSQRSTANPGRLDRGQRVPGRVTAATDRGPDPRAVGDLQERAQGLAVGVLHRAAPVAPIEAHEERIADVARI
jgi:hypothetical protein